MTHMLSHYSVGCTCSSVVTSMSKVIFTLYKSCTVRQEILTAIKLDEFDELFVSIFNSSNFY